MSDHDQRLMTLIEIGRALVAELDPEAVLDRILHEARELTGARYAALGVVGEGRDRLERFLTSGIDEQTRRAIGALPHGRGVLGLLISDPRPLRLTDVSEHPQSSGFPAHHPPMRTFLGVPIMIRGQAWGNLYLSEKADGKHFTDADEDAVTLLAQWAATAIENARLYDNSERRRADAEHAVRSLRAAQDIADAIGSVAELDHVLELIVRRARALVEARSVLILLHEDDVLVVAASAGPVPAGLDIAAELGVPHARSALTVPMLHRGVEVGVLAAFSPGLGDGSFDQPDEQLLRTFAASAANAVAIKRSVDADRLHAQIAAAEGERRRWARELHDQTLQSLGAMRMLLSAAARQADPQAHADALAQAIDDLELEADNLRGIITDLRPSLLDDLGLVPALDALLDRRRDAGLVTERDIDVPALADGGPRLDPELATTVYRLVQEALSNVVKHSGARTCHVTVRLIVPPGEQHRREQHPGEQHPGEQHRREQLLVEVRDDGHGYDTSSRTSGFGLQGMRERVHLAGGRLELVSGGGGTVVRAHIPLGGGGQLG
ncbi:MAG: GAF domain-containing sensor histidine kinase [Conexibacteraceae bacterium]|nr:GAF domain-containing sensor histidine kinase [Conexibacteraceae bacterium]